MTTKPDIRRLVQEALTGAGYDVATAANGKEAVRMSASFLPDLVLLDIMMPDADGFTVAGWLRREADLPHQSRHLPHGAARDRQQAAGLPLGGRGLRHQAVPHPRAARPRAGAPEGPGAVKDAPPSPLTEREREVVALLADGRTYKQVATAMRLSQSTVRNHLHNVYSKLGVVDRAQAVIVSRDNGWI